MKGGRRTRCCFRIPAAVSLILSALFPVMAHSERWPSRTVRIFVPYAAGGNSDGMARITAQRLTEALGQTFVVENRLGANGALAGESVVRAPPDGYTLLWAVSPPMTIAPALQRLTYDPVKDFAPITVVGINGFVLVVNKEVAAKTIGGFVAYVKAQPKILSYAEGSAGSVTHLGMALFLNRAGLTMQSVSYRGNAPALNDVIAGHLPAMLSNISDAIPHAQSGAIRLLGVSTQMRATQLPNVPTIAESGFPGFAISTWNGLAVRSGTPPEIIAKIAAEIRRAVKDPSFVARLDGYGAEPLGNTPEAFGALIKTDAALWADAIKSAGIAFQ
jgi:tripartite-type tricarboxylate transporter receptor subunit TctC